MPRSIDLQAVLKGIALIEKATSSPLVKAAIIHLLPDFGLTPEEIAHLDSNHEDYQRMLKEAHQRAGHPASE